MRAKILLVVAIALFSVASRTQEIPPGVRYKKASASTNQKAYDFLKKLTTKAQPEAGLLNNTSQVLCCGPGLWSALKGVAPKSLQSAMPITYVVPNSSGTQTFHGKGFKTAAQQTAFWKLFQAYLDKYRLLPKNRPKDGIKIRKANRGELAHYWALISYDLEEPIYIVAIGGLSILFEFSMEGGKAKVFTVDIVAWPNKPK